MPAAKLRPVAPSTSTAPPVMYSQPWSPHALDHRGGAAVAHGEALAGGAADEQLPAGRAVERGVAGGASAPRAARITTVPPHRPLPGWSLHGPSRSISRPRGANAPRLCPPTPLSSSRIGAGRQPGVAVAAGDLPGQRRADAAVRVARRRRRSAPASPCGAPGAARATSSRSARRRTPAARRRGPASRRRLQQRREVEAGRMPDLLQQLGSADHFVEGRGAQLGEQLAHPLGQEQEVPDDVLGRAGEPPPQLAAPASRSRPGRCSGGRRASSRSRRRPAAPSRTRTPPRPASPRPARRGACAARRPPAGGRGRAARWRTSTCCASASPSSQGSPACLIEESGDAPVPPSCPRSRRGRPAPWRRRRRSCRRPPRRPA